MGKIKKILNDLWLYSKGNKTIFLQMVWIAIESGVIILTGPWLLFARGILSILIGGSLYDHHKSGFFKKG